MDIKKAKNVDLESRKAIFFEIGLVVALGVLFLAFEWRTDSAEKGGFNDQVNIEQIEDEIIPITQQMLKPPPPPPQPPRVTDIIDIVEDDIDLTEKLDITDAEDVSENVTNPTDYDYEGYEGEYGDDEVFVVAEHMPVFPPGDVTKWLAKNTRYPPLAEQNGIQGRVFVKFVVEKDGSVSNVEIVRGADPSLDKEALRVVNSMPKWKPGKQRDKAVRVSFTVPINFYLQ